MKYKRESDETIRKEETSRFLIDEFDRIIAQLLTDFRKSNKDASDEEICLRKDQYSVQLLESDRISNKFQKLLQILPSSYPRRKEVMITMNEEYNNITKQMKIYKQSLDLEVQKRELDKEQSFSASFINVKLQKFKGLSSEMDVYSFRSEFEKLYTKDTPKKMLSNLLKHNHLANPALAMVKSLDDINEIWKRLQKSI